MRGGNLTNTDELVAGLGGRMMKTTSDSEALLNVFAEVGRCTLSSFDTWASKAVRFLKSRRREWIKSG